MIKLLVEILRGENLLAIEILFAYSNTSTLHNEARLFAILSGQHLLPLNKKGEVNLRKSRKLRKFQGNL